ncbi:MAG: hypothetical protein LIO95_02465 [Clostridiales bacterium]|nr:hypothetical protein [Clostridiales bacterium]
MFGNNDKKAAKADAKAAKEAAKAEKERQKQDELLRKFGVEGLNDPKSVEIVRDISATLCGDDLIELGASLGGASEKDLLHQIYRHNQVQTRQNWLIIRQLDRIATALESKDQ